MKSMLSGMPELKLGLNDKLLFEATGKTGRQGKAVEMEDIRFHQVSSQHMHYIPSHSNTHLHL